MAMIAVLVVGGGGGGNPRQVEQSRSEPMRRILNALIRTLPNGGRVYQTPGMGYRGIEPIPQWMVPDWLHRLIERRDRQRYPWLYNRRQT